MNASELVEKWVVEITSINEDGEYHVYRGEHDTLQYATRDVLTYVKRGYLTIEFKMTRESRLF